MIHGLLALKLAHLGLVGRKGARMLSNLSSGEKAVLAVAVGVGGYVLYSYLTAKPAGAQPSLGVASVPSGNWQSRMTR